MEERLPHFLIGVFVVPSRVVKSTKQFLAPTLRTALHQLGQENAHRIVIGNRKPMRMLSHDCCTSTLQIIFVLAWIRVGDELRVRIFEAESVDNPRERFSRDPSAEEKRKKRYVMEMAKKFGWRIQRPHNRDSWFITLF
jgi:hypothetical protein